MFHYKHEYKRLASVVWMNNSSVFEVNIVYIALSLDFIDHYTDSMFYSYDPTFYFFLLMFIFGFFSSILRS